VFEVGLYESNHGVHNAAAVITDCLSVCIMQLLSSRSVGVHNAAAVIMFSLLLERGMYWVCFI
jgi:hypothetical protein